MKVFRVAFESNDFQSFLPSDSTVWETDLLKMDCRKKLSEWVPPSIYILNPMLERGNVFHFCSGAFVVDSLALEAVRTPLEVAGELLPLPHKGELFHLVNVLECVNCLDEDKTKWAYGKRTNARIGIDEYFFYADRFSESTLFKIPETALGEVLTVSGIKDPEDEFKSLVESAGLKGILFEELWSSS